MAIFPSREWLSIVVEALNGHPDLPKAIEGLGDDMAAVVEADPPHLMRPFAVYGRRAPDGRVGTFRVLDDEDEILELEPAYVFRAPYAVWKELLRGGDPVKLAMGGRVKVKGDLQALVKRAHYRYIADEAMAGGATQFADEV